MKNADKSKMPKTERSFEGLRGVLFDALDDLRSGKAKPEVANATSRVAAEIVKTTALQFEIMRFTTLRGKSIPKDMGLLK